MVLNYLFVFFFLGSFAIALVRLIFFQDYEVFSRIVKSTFDGAETTISISIYLIGVMTFWLGIMKIGEDSGMIQRLAQFINPVFKKLFPSIPDNHPAQGSIILNFSANMLGLDNAATPLGLKAMKELQTLNPTKDTISDAQIMFLVLNTSGLTIIPVSVMALRASNGAANPTDVFIPILLATTIATVVGLIAVSIKQKINLFSPTLILTVLGLGAFVGCVTFSLSQLTKEVMETFTSIAGNGIIFGVMCLFILAGLYIKLNVYNSFIEGAKQGFETSIKIIPYLAAMLISIGIFRASGGLDLITTGVAFCLGIFGARPEIADAIPTALMKPLSGSGARGFMVEAMKNFGPDSLTAKITGVIQGSTETTFYTIATYLGSVGITKARYTVAAGLLADFAGILTAIIIAIYFFG